MQHLQVSRKSVVFVAAAMACRPQQFITWAVGQGVSDPLPGCTGRCVASGARPQGQPLCRGCRGLLETDASWNAYQRFREEIEWWSDEETGVAAGPPQARQETGTSERADEPRRDDRLRSPEPGRVPRDDGRRVAANISIGSVLLFEDADSGAMYVARLTAVFAAHAADEPQRIFVRGTEEVREINLVERSDVSRRRERRERTHRSRSK